MSLTKKYVINVDSAKSKLHLNPLFFDDMWCHLNEDKKREDGGKIEVTKKEAIGYLTGKKPLIFNGREFRNLSPCENCSSRCKQSVHWDLP